jgi:hypothetical protein
MRMTGWAFVDQPPPRYPSHGAVRRYLLRLRRRHRWLIRWVADYQMIDTWAGCYRNGWTGEIVPEAFSHPAKFSRSLIQHIYQHILEEGWVMVGDCIVDPFGGVALGGLDAMVNGLNWTGCELEQKFVDLGQQNIDLWNARYWTLPHFGTAKILQGDSRSLAQVIEAAGACVSSPPYAESPMGGIAGGEGPNTKWRNGKEKSIDEINSRSLGDGYGQTPGNLGNLKANDSNWKAVVSSPPYADSIERPGGIDPAKSDFIGGPHSQMNNSDTRYGSTPGQLGSMPAKGFEGVISSPPFLETSGGHNITATEGYLADPALMARHRGGNRAGEGYGNSEGQLANGNTDDFWSAARLIVSQVYAVLSPGAHAVWVVKSYVKGGKIVDFPHQWQALCEACGFVTVHEHHASLVEDRGTQGTLDGGSVTKTVARKSFFRRLAEAKGSPRIDYETVLCTRKDTL